MAFKPVVQKVEIDNCGTPATFYTRNASGRERLAYIDSLKKKERSNTENVEYMVSTYVVHENGEALSKAEFEDVMDLDSLALDDLVGAVAKRLVRDPEKKS